MIKKKIVKRIKENISEVEYKKLMLSLRGDDSLRETTRLNLQRCFTILYYTGMRVNELQGLTIFHIKELVKNGSVKIFLNKTNSERKLYLTKNFKKDLLKCFEFEIEEDDNRVIFKASNKRKKTGIHPISFIQLVNKYLKYILGNGYTSHSFRQGLLSELGAKGTNIKIMSKFIGHSDVKTTLSYITPSDEDIMMNLTR